MKNLPIFLCFVAGVSSNFVQQQKRTDWTVGQTVQTTSGPVNGHPAPNLTEVSEYLGIPFAKPPLGNLRWTAPQKYTGNSTINGTSFGFSCPAILQVSSAGSISNLANANLTAAGLTILSSLGQLSDSFSEDCLTVNVWTKPQTGDAKKAVLVWIYGGSFLMGNTRNPIYSGKHLAEQEGVIVVSLNYRLSIFGFPGAPDVTQNLALLDQRLAVEWVRDNIEKFGGDPSRITLFGQSAGSISIDYFSYAWTSDPIVNGFIQQSGTLGASNQLNASAAATSWNSFANHLNCTGDSSEALDCMRALSTETIITALSTTFLNVSFNRPVIDETVVFSDYRNRSLVGNFIRRPLVVGGTNYESGIYKTQATLGGITLPDSYWETGNIQLNCGVSNRANISIANGVPTWRYRWFGDFPNTQLTSIPPSGAYHTSELPVLFDSAPSGIGIPANTPAENEIGEYFRGAWAAFAKDPENGLKEYGWPDYATTGETLIQLGYNNLTGVNAADWNSFDSVCNATFVVEGNKTDDTGTAPSGTSTPTPSATATNGAGNVKVKATKWLGIVGAIVIYAHLL